MPEETKTKAIAFRTTPDVQKYLKSIRKFEKLTTHEILERLTFLYNGSKKYSRDELFDLLFPASKLESENDILREFLEEGKVV